MINSKSAIYILQCIVFMHFVNSAVLRDDLYRLDIIHYNDFHARFEETSVLYPVCQNNDTSCLGGFARLYHEIMTLLKEKPDALLLDAGDTYQGTYWYTLLKWNITQHFINMLPNDAHALGNHEFDDSVEGLVPYLEALRAPVVAANLDTSKEPSLNGLYQPHIKIKKRGKRIGIIGLITTDTKSTSNPRNVIFLDPIQAARREAQILTDQEVDIIVVLSHCGLEVDKNIAKTAGENIDIIVGGHSHSLLWNSASPSNESISGPYPVMIEAESKPGHKVLIVTASAFSKYLGNLTAYFDDQGELVSFDGNPVFLNRSIPEDPEIKALLLPYKNRLHEMVKEIVGYSNNDLLVETCEIQECGLGNLIADAFLNASNEARPSNLTRIAFLSRKIIRASLPKGEITRGAVINIMPFTNKIITFVLFGSQIEKALKWSLSSRYLMPQFAGLQVTVNQTSAQTLSVLVKEDEGYQPLDLNKLYQITTLDFLAKGRNGFTMFQEATGHQTTVGYDAELVERYLRKVSPIVTNYLDNRFVWVCNKNNDSVNLGHHVK